MSTTNCNKRVEQLSHIHKNSMNVFIKKNADYGDAFATYGIIGVLVRIQDKLQRLVSISKNKIVLTHDEKMQDTLLDLHNYAAMALMLLEEEEEEHYNDDDTNIYEMTDNTTSESKK